MKHEYPNFFARFYDLIYAKIRTDVDEEYFLDKISKAEGRVLEVGCGTGRFISKALKKGANIYGMDISQSMLDQAVNKLNKNDQFRLSNQNITDFSFDFHFDLIIAPFRVFSHLLSIEEQIKALKNVHRNLNKGGIFIFDLFIPNLNMLQNGLDHIVDFESEDEKGEKVKRTVNMHADLIKQLSIVDFKIDWTEKGVWKSETWHTELRYFFRFELEHLLRQSPFSGYKIYGDYQENELTNESKDFLVICF